MNKDEEIKQLKATIKEQNEQLRLHSVSNCCDWKVEYYKSDIDRLRDIKTVDEFDNFESAKDFTIMKIGNKMGAVRLIHPDID